MTLKNNDLTEVVRDLDLSADEEARSLLVEAGERMAESALAVCRGMGLLTCVFGGVLFDCSTAARGAVEDVFAAPGHICTPRFLTQLFEARAPDDLAAASVAYHLLSDRRSVQMLDGHSSGEAILLRQQS